MLIERIEDAFWEEPFESVRITPHGNIDVRFDGTDLSLVDQIESHSGDMCWLRLTPYQIAQMARGLQAIQKERFCPECGGEGEVKSRYGPEDDEYDVADCDVCAGTGMPPEREVKLCQTH